MTDLDMILATNTHAARWQSLETVDVDVLQARRRLRRIAQRVLAVVLTLVMVVCAFEVGASRLGTAALRGVAPAPPALQVSLPPAPGT